MGKQAVQIRVQKDSSCAHDVKFTTKGAANGPPPKSLTIKSRTFWAAETHVLDLQDGDVLDVSMKADGGCDADTTKLWRNPLPSKLSVDHCLWHFDDKDIESKQSTDSDESDS